MGNVRTRGASVNETELRAAAGHFKRLRSPNCPLWGVTELFSLPEALQLTLPEGQSKVILANWRQNKDWWLRLLADELDPWMWSSREFRMFSTTPTIQNGEASYDVSEICLQGSLPFLFRLLMGPTAVSGPWTLSLYRGLHSLKIYWSIRKF